MESLMEAKNLKQEETLARYFAFFCSKLTLAKLGRAI